MATATSVSSAGDDWSWWASRRPQTVGIHLDSAAAGRSSLATLDAVTAHTHREASDGAYVVADRAAPTIADLRAQLGRLLGVDEDGVALVESAETALDALLRRWRLHDDDEVAVAPSEWGPNVHAFTARGLRVGLLDVDDDGHVDLDALESRLVTAPPAVVQLTQQASHRALRQPAEEVARLCAYAGVPLWIDAAQTLGHAPVAAGAAAVWATSRKWLTGPRGVGVLAVAAPWREHLDLAPSPMAPDLPPLRVLEHREAHVAGRVGLANAVAELLEVGVAAVAARLDEVGRTVRHELAGLAGWQVVGPLDAPGAITAIEPLDGRDVFAVRERLLGEHGILTTACSVARAPLEMTRPSLRISPHVDLAPEHVVALRTALATA